MRCVMRVGEKAPDFTLCDQSGKTVSLTEFAGKKVVLYFYPKDNTPGCTRQACAFGQNYHEFQERGIVVIGISKDSVESHRKFAEKYDLDREECLWLISVIGFSDEVRAVVENAAKEAGFKKIRWIQAGGVITTHGGPAAFGLAGFSRKK